VHGQHRDLVIVRQPAENVDVLARRIGGHHDLETVVSELRGHLEGGGRFLRVDGRSRQHDRRVGYLEDFFHNRQAYAFHGPERCGIPHAFTVE
jgi:hypothetical protein